MRVLKYVIPIDDQWHEIPLVAQKGPTLGYEPHVHISQQDDPRAVVLWYPAAVDNPDRQRVKVVGTGHEYEGWYLGSTQDREHGLVWHVIVEVTS